MPVPQRFHRQDATDFTGKMPVPQRFVPVPQRFHRQDACATRISQARCLCHKDFTGKMPVPQGFHRQDACATRISQARCLCHKDFTGKMPVPQGFHRQDACATRILVGWASARPKYLHRQDACATKILVGWASCPPKYLHRQDACATKILVGWASCPPQIFAQARCLCHKNSCGVGILPAPNICTGKMPVPQKFLWGGHLARPKYLKSPKDRPHKQPHQLTLHWDSKQDEQASFLTANPSGLCA
jgi:hypothetical protein